MRTSNFILAIVGVAFLGAGAAHALDAAPRPQPLTPALSPALAPATKYGSARDALRSGMRTYNAGDKIGAGHVLQNAAGAGHPLGPWELRGTCAAGDGGRPTHLKGS